MTSHLHCLCRSQTAHGTGLDSTPPPPVWRGGAFRYYPWGQVVPYVATSQISHTVKSTVIHTPKQGCFLVDALPAQVDKLHNEAFLTFLGTFTNCSSIEQIFKYHNKNSNYYKIHTSLRGLPDSHKSSLQRGGLSVSKPRSQFLHRFESFL